MNTKYKTFEELKEAAAEHDFDFSPINDTRILVFGPMGAILYRLNAEGSWVKSENK